MTDATYDKAIYQKMISKQHFQEQKNIFGKRSINILEIRNIEMIGPNIHSCKRV